MTGATLTSTGADLAQGTPLEEARKVFGKNGFMALKC